MKQFRRSIWITVLCIVLACAALGGCTFTPPASEVAGIDTGWYVLQRKTVAGADVTDTFVANAIQLKADGTVYTYAADYSGVEQGSGTFTVEDGTVKVQIGIKTYEYAFDKDAKMLSYSGRINKQQVIMKYRYKEDFALSGTTKGVSFTDELFGESKDENFYNYCPTAMLEGNNVMHIWYCSNEISGNVTDYVAYRKGVLNDSGKWVFSDKKLVLSPTAGTWDERHTCDPSVVKGSFEMGGEQYSYLMSYLGCRTSDNTRNEVGIAVAKAPEGPWIKVDSINPIANFYTSTDYAANPASWGYGQPCVISSDKAGRIFLIYTKGVKVGTFAYLEEWDLSDLDAPSKVRETALSMRGVVNASGGSDVINNADFAYDPHTERLYCIKEDFPYPTDGEVNWITASNTLMYIDLANGFETLFSSHQWVKIGAVTAEAMGFHRVHNMGILTDVYGQLVDPYVVPILYTTSDAKTDHPLWNKGGQWPALHTYRIHGTTIEVK